MTVGQFSRDVFSFRLGAATVGHALQHRPTGASHSLQRKDLHTISTSPNDLLETKTLLQEIVVLPSCSR